jgi:hypothetical protein
LGCGRVVKLVLVGGEGRCGDWGSVTGGVGGDVWLSERAE